MNKNRIIIPDGPIPQNPPKDPRQTVVQVPVFPIPVRSNDSYLMYALSLYILETGVYNDMPEILPQLQNMKTALETAYVKLGIPAYEYRKFVVSVPSIIDTIKNWVKTHPKEAAVEKEFADEGESGGTTAFKGSVPMKDILEEVIDLLKEGEQENVEMGKEKE